MNFSMTLQVDVMTTMIAVMTVLTAVVIGLATLARPSRATITWGIAFGVGMLGAYVWFAGHQLDEPKLRALASGLLLAFEPIVWLGLRKYHRRTAPLAFVVTTLVLFPTGLLLAAGTPAYQPVFHVVFLVAGVYAALIIRELSRLVPAHRDVVMPLALASGAFVVIAVVAAFSSLWGPAMGVENQGETIRGVNTVGTLVLNSCAAFTLVLLVRGGGTAPAVVAASAVSARLARVQRRDDRSWSVLDVRLDDPVDLDQASTGADFAAITRRFHQDIAAALPVGADIERVSDSRAVVAISHGDDAIREHLRELLQRVSTVAADNPVFGIRVSASIGWASAAAVGSDEDVLRTAAAAAAVMARADGGDCWKRAPAVPVTMG